MKLSNPLTFEYSHPNFNGQTVKVSLNHSPDLNTVLTLDAVGINGKTGYAQLQFGDNGNVTVRIDEDPSNIFVPLIV